MCSALSDMDAPGSNRTVEKGGRGGKRPRAWAPKGPVNILCHKILLLLYISAVHFYGNSSAFKRVFARTVYFDDSYNVRDQTVVLIFLIYRNWWFYSSSSVIGVVGSLSFRSPSIYSAFESLVPAGTNKALLA